MILEFGEWLPDQTGVNNPGILLADNVLPAAIGYRPVYAATAHNSGALNVRCQGAISAIDRAGNVSNFAANTNDLFKLSGTSWVNVSATTGAYGVLGQDFWEFAVFNNSVLAAGDARTTSNMIQKYNLASSTSFADVGGGAPSAKHIAVVRDFVVTGNTYDATDATRTNRVRWSAIGDETSWTVSATTQADFNDLPGNGGEVQRITGGEYGLVFQQRAVWRMSYVGSPIVFQFDNILPDIGTPAPQSVVKLGENVFFLGRDGFRVIVGGQRSEKIGSEKVDRNFFDNVDTAYVMRINGVAEPDGNRIWWAYPTSPAAAGLPEFALLFAIDTRRWTRVEIDGSYLYDFLASSTAQPQIGFWNNTQLTIKDSATYIAADIRTKEFDAGTNTHMQINRIKLLIGSGGVATNPVSAVKVRSRNSLGEAATVHTFTYDSSSRTYTGRATGRFHQINILGNTATAPDWFWGVDLDVVVRRGVR